MENFIQYLVIILSLISGIFAWIAKINWSKEFKEAKQAEVMAKEAQIAAIKEKNSLLESIFSQKLFDHSKKTIQGLEAILESVDTENVEMKNALERFKNEEKSYLDFQNEWDMERCKLEASGFYEKNYEAEKEKKYNSVYSIMKKNLDKIDDTQLAKITKEVLTKI